MKNIIISFSLRSDSQSLKVANRLKDLSSKDLDSEVIDLHSLNLPINLDQFWSNKELSELFNKEVTSKLAAADCATFILPEWDGGVPASFALFKNLIGHSLAFKPILLVGVSSGIGGRYPLAEARVSSAKNTHWSLIPDQLVVMGVEGVMNHDQPSEEDDLKITKRAKYSLDLLEVYAKAYTSIRSSDKIDLEEYKYAM
jgi:NAD(P)H-dependent FMN reductase